MLFLRRIPLIILCALAAAGPPARADILYDTLPLTNPGDLWATTDSDWFGFQIAVNGSGYLSSGTVWVQGTGDSFTLQVWSDSGMGEPDALIEASAVATFPGALAETTTSFSGTNLLSPGNLYWLVLAPSTPAGGDWARGDFGTLLRGNPGSWFADTGGIGTAKLEGLDAPAGGGGGATPEPGTLMLLGAGLAAAALRRRRGVRTG